MVCLLERKGAGRMKSKKPYRVLIPIIALLICGIIILLERNGITYKETLEEHKELVFTPSIAQEKTCLILTNEEEVSGICTEIMCDVLEGMKIGYDVYKAEDFSYDLVENYETVVLTFQSWLSLGEDLQQLFAWVKKGGSLMNTLTPDVDAGFLAVSGKVGIENIDDEYPLVDGFQFFNDCLAGAPKGRIFPIEQMQGALGIQLDSECRTYMASGDGKVPLLWTKQYGEGQIAITNNVLTEKYQRGFLCLAYSLLPDACIYPVINASAFYLDDFPAPVPGGNSTYIFRDYGVDTATFYSNIWWPQILKWEENYDIVHTGLIIEQYSDEVEAPFVRNKSTTQFLSYGNMLLKKGGELGFHGYNHMPLCLEGMDEDKQFGEYELWKGTEDVQASMKELLEFSTGLFPKNQFRVYVPPSNILSESGREALLAACPDIKVIAATYLRDAEGIAYEQDFCVSEDGIINTPRITSGCEPEDYQYLTALSELNFHYVQSHFMHPDDVLDEDRGAANGWEALAESFEEYLEWIYSAVPEIRNVTGSGMGDAVEIYDTLSVTRSYENNLLTVKLGGFSGEAEFLMRIRDGSIQSTTGCTWEKVTENLYAVHATAEEFQIELGE